MNYKVLIMQQPYGRWAGTFFDNDGDEVGACSGPLWYVMRNILDFAKNEGMSITGSIELHLTTTLKPEDEPE